MDNTIDLIKFNQKTGLCPICKEDRSGTYPDGVEHITCGDDYCFYKWLLRRPPSSLTDAHLRALYQKAEEYADLSEEYTKDFSGWKDKFKKHQRIATGRFAQLCCYHEGKARGVKKAIFDDTDYKTADNFDIKFGEIVVDVKSTRHFDLGGQCHQANQSRHADFYCFVIIETHKNINYPHFLGLVPFETYWGKCVFVGPGGKIPGTNLRNRFKCGTNFLNKHTGFSFRDEGVSLEAFFNMCKMLQGVPLN